MLYERFIHSSEYDQNNSGQAKNLLTAINRHDSCSEYQETPNIRLVAKDLV